MTKLLKLAFAAAVALSLSSTVASADVAKGQKLYSKKLKKACGFNGAVLAKKHTQDEWKAKFDAGELNAHIKTICPKAKPLKKKYVPHVFDFLHNYASDSGNVPSC